MVNTTLGYIIGVSSHGFAPERLVERKTSLRYILDQDVDGIGELIASTLTTNMRLLHHVIGWIFIMKIGQFDFVSERELAFLYHLIQGNSMNLPGLMLVLMREIVERVKACLPCNMVLTWCLRLLAFLLKWSPLRNS